MRHNLQQRLSINYWYKNYRPGLFSLWLGLSLIQNVQSSVFYVIAYVFVVLACQFKCDFVSGIIFVQSSAYDSRVVFLNRWLQIVMSFHYDSRCNMLFWLIQCVFDLWQVQSRQCFLRALFIMLLGPFIRVKVFRSGHFVYIFVIKRDWFQACIFAFYPFGLSLSRRRTNSIVY